jgi:multiple sugar transport system permease protein
VQTVFGGLSDRLATVLLMAPTIVLLGLIFVIPLAVSLGLSVFGQASSAELIPSRFVGLRNYSDLVGDSDFLATVGRTLTYTFFAVLFEVVLGFLMALVLNVEMRFMHIARTILIVPMMMTPIVAALMWKLGFDVNHGFVNHVVPTNIIWLGSAVPAFVAMVTVNVWQNAPYVALILLAGLRAMPQELLDAATVDGATRLQRIVHVVIPTLAPHLLLAVFLRTIFEFRAFENIYVLTGGGPGTSTMVLSVFTYVTSFVSFDLGLSAAAAWLTLVLTLLLCGLLLLAVNRRMRANAS